METPIPPYNATVTLARQIHDELLILRVEPDFGRLPFLPGQYTTLGLGSWEPRVPCQEPESTTPELIRRAYSISHSPVDEQGRLIPPGTGRELEFYIALVRHSPRGRPLLTPRLFRREAGERIYIGPRARGTYTLAHVPADANVLFAATGTGEAPHNAMIAALLVQGHRGRIASLVCVRHRRDLAYAEQHAQLAEKFSHYRYITLTTRERENLDRSHPAFVGKRYVQDILRSPDAADLLGFSLDPARTHVFLCGNPEMIGLPTAGEQSATQGAVHVLESLGFHIDSSAHPGNIHFERYF